MTESDLPIVRTDGGNDALTLADRDFRHELTRFRPYRCREGDYIIMASFPDEMIGNGMKSERFLWPEISRKSRRIRCGLYSPL